MKGRRARSEGLCQQAGATLSRVGERSRVEMVKQRQGGNSGVAGYGCNRRAAGYEIWKAPLENCKLGAQGALFGIKRNRRRARVEGGPDRSQLRLTTARRSEDHNHCEHYPARE